MSDGSHISRALIATIKDMGSCPCPHCLTPKGLFGYLGLAKDMKCRVSNLRVYVTTKVAKAHEFIYGFGNTVDGAKVDNTLGEGSINSSEKLGPLGLDPFRMLVVDLMHECELACRDPLTRDFAKSRHLVAAVIHKFANNTSEMKKLAARDFEDILQCAIPIFEGLFPPNHDATVQSLLYRFSEWHALAKLRLHSDSTLVFLEESFKTSPSSCESFGPTHVLPSTLWSYQKRERLVKEGLISVLKPTMSPQNPRGPR
ncbi:hypothetical protein DFJ58DRAFT_727662 [Suillus subalutaceus]|uniref:uncharacterized protein n=1 Tax=Suillus subalutaceus TaxID=48586 RepID=UPI001B86C01B|nr:uncharacterized protein DFJ58DRAFT_727662 [Suillus subalutaceus]KAG1855220.1 hypothetical protein DFJ58DRAFT_727662 [Suillus subalutaceus]